MKLEKYYMKKQAKEWIKFAKTDLQATIALITEENIKNTRSDKTIEKNRRRKNLY